MKYQISSLRYYVDLIWHLILRDFTLRYKGSILGVMWVMVSPLMQLATLVFIFKRVLPLNIDSYPAFVLTGLLPWTWFSSCLAGAGTLFIANRDLVRRPNFPPVILITISTFTNLLFYLIVMPLLLITLLAYGHSLGWTILLFPLLLLVQSILIQGLSLMIATWNVFYRDIQQIVGVLVGLLFWITPVFYRASSADSKYQFLFNINPIAVLIKSYRDILFYSQLPQWGEITYAAAFSAVIWSLGYFVYSRQLHKVVDAL
jgi:ABC-type polysaccharide/polyol phosphate export permease